MAAKIHPLYDKIVVKRVEAEETTKGGIVLPDAAQEKPKEGVVVAVGKGMILPDGALVEPQLKVGDRILFGGYGGTEVKVDGEDHLILRESEVLAVIDG